MQRIRPAHPGLAGRALTDWERGEAAGILGGDGVLLFWALKEAAIKARRRAWGRALREITVTLDGVEPGCAWIAIAGEPTQNARYELREGWWLARSVRPRADATAGGAV